MMSSVTKTRVAFALLLAAILLLAAGGDQTRDALRYERAYLPFQHWWRWLGAHLVHLTRGHTLLNATGLVLIYLLFAPLLSAARWLLVFVAGVGAIGAGFWLLDPELQWYVGLSGVLHALFAAGAITEIVAGRRAGIGLLAGLIAKLAWEQWFGPLPLTASSAGGPVIVNAHLYGALGGALACALIWADGRRRRGEAAKM